MNCIESIAREMVPLLQSGKTPSQVAEKYHHEDADLVGEALVEAMALMAGESDNMTVQEKYDILLATMRDIGHIYTRSPDVFGIIARDCLDEIHEPWFIHKKKDQK